MNAINLSVMAGAKALHKPKSVNPVDGGPAQIGAGLSELVCVERWNETIDVVSFRFQAGEPMKFDYKPGQFMTFVLDINGEQVCRSYTLSSSPSRPYSLMVTIKRVAGGLVSNYLIDHLQPGQRVRVLPPMGQFNLVDIPAQKYLFLSAGCGITPMYSMSRYLTDTQIDADIAFVHSARSDADIIFKSSLETMANRFNAFKLSYALESAAASLLFSPKISFDIGRLTAQMLQTLVPDVAERTVYLCGPEPYMQAVKALLAELNFDISRLHHESFATAEKAARNQLMQAKSSETDENPQAEAFTLPTFNLAIGDRSTRLTQGQSLLEGIESEGLPIIAACRSGVCGACKCQVLEGETVSTSVMTLSAAEIDAGFVLACSTTLTSDVTLKL
ncbi:Nitric oxide dioxygenase [Shewanella baltica OS625]|uniref:Oxidoreductase FAD-binding domain protein n=1 Tax=Shewanella baltica (strain OS195) TaxID=399599 RepID=A9L5Q2_SHEB9|nr:hybrid-cluster NAD(P)-dependent oxidoreductase [Shewanella baltica]ABX48469.1 Oxidoreductase FAD-binding domain protein [Shewanella baltica OS195]ADT93501.1 Oxidoreductase FAD-binding domain protein [Shewanella baltica OS678]EHC06722.1 Nitric oxide dioxygenase [Shewanella baltica OS625]